MTESDSQRRPSPWHQATAAAERIPHHLDRRDDTAAQAHIAAVAEALDVLPLIAPGHHLRAQLQQAALAFERASRSRIRARQDQSRALRGAIRTLRTAPATGDGTGLAMFLDITILVVIAAARWHQARRNDQQVAATHQTLVHLQAAYEQAADRPLTALAQHKPPAHTVERHAQHIRAVLPHHAEQILEDLAWPALATALTRAETAGHAPRQLLELAARQRSLDDARSTAKTLTWRIQRLGTRPAPSQRARAAQARSAATARATRSAEPHVPGTSHQPSATASHPRHR